MSNSLAEIVVARLLQGVFGAALVPLSQVVLMRNQPARKAGSAMAIWGMGVMVGPILGPDAGRLADRQLQLALGLLHQRADRHAGHLRHVAIHPADARAARASASTYSALPP